MDVPLLVQNPLILSLREFGDLCRPAVLQEGTPSAKVFDEFIKSVVTRLKML
jgi:ATP-binding protein involved in chromosome partitioning